jgi:hypothetical protein
MVEKYGLLLQHVFHALYSSLRSVREVKSQYFTMNLSNVGWIRQAKISPKFGTEMF